MDEPDTISEVMTPCLVLDIDRVKHNASRMIDRCQRLGVRLRPHMKTHKCREVADILTGGSMKGIVVSTLAEAEYFSNAGYDDIIYGSVFTQDKLPRMIKLACNLSKFVVMVDSEYGVELLKGHRLPDGKIWSVVLKVDCGGGRSGVLWHADKGVELAQKIQNNPYLTLEGLYAHEGNSYCVHGAEHVKEIGAITTERIKHLAQRMLDEGIEASSISIGSTPTCSQPDGVMGQLTEVHPGNYCFYDEQQHIIGSCQLSDIAMRVATRVKGHFPHRNQLLVDAGFTSISLDGKDAMPGGGYCSVDGHPDLRVTKMSQEIGYVENIQSPIKFEKYPIGSLLFLLPYHACATSTRHQFYYVHSDKNIIDKWHICSGW